MTSEEESSGQQIRTSSSTGHGVAKNKKRKLARACDICRQKKIKCDGPNKRAGEECTPCKTYNRQCTFVEDAKKRGPPIGYLRYVENRMDRLEAALKFLAPTFDIESNIGPRHSQSSWAAANHQDIPHMSNQSTEISPSIRPPSIPLSAETEFSRHQSTIMAQPVPAAISALSLPDTLAGVHHISHKSETPDSSEGEEGFTQAGIFQFSEDNLPEQFSKLQLGTSAYHGKSSNIRILQHALSMRNEITRQTGGLRPEVTPGRKGQVWEGSNTWKIFQPFQASSAESLIFPPEDLSDALIVLYFRFFHPLFPTLHRSSFEAQVKEGLHKTHLTCGIQFLLVCAIGSRWSKDPRVCETPDTMASELAEVDWKLAGWPYFAQVIHSRQPFSSSSGLPDLQNTLLFGTFGMSSHTRHSAWLVAGYGVRCAMDLGAHRRKAYRPDRPLQNEIWKRTFWCLVNLDRMTSSNLGRPPAINDEDIDVDLPLDVNDDYWDETLQSWKTNDHPSQMRYFIHSTKLIQILSFAMKTIYSINKTRFHLGLVGEEWETRVMAELDNALNAWADEMPDHLRWDSGITDPIFFDQAVALNFSYHYAQIFVHRRFLTGSSKKPSPLAFNSLAICTNAARSISHIVDTHLKWMLAGKHSPHPDRQFPAAVPMSPVVSFLAAVVLLISIWGANRSGGNVDVTALAGDVQKLLRYLEFAEERHPRVGGFVKTLRELASVKGFPLSQDGGNPAVRPSFKRPRAQTDDGPKRHPVPQHSSLYQEYSPVEFVQPEWMTSVQAHPSTHGIPPTDLPEPVQTLPTQSPSPQTGPGFLGSQIAGNPALVFPNFFSSIPDPHLQWSNSASASTAGGFNPATPPITLGAPDGESGYSEVVLSRDYLIPKATVPATGNDPPPGNDISATAHHLLMGNTILANNLMEDTQTGGESGITGVGGLDSAATPYLRAYASEQNTGYEPSQLLQGTTDFRGLDEGHHSQTAAAPDLIPQHLQLMHGGFPSSSVGFDWESWISDTWGLSDGQPPT